MLVSFRSETWVSIVVSCLNERVNFRYSSKQDKSRRGSKMAQAGRRVAKTGRVSDGQGQVGK